MKSFGVLSILSREVLILSFLDQVKLKLLGDFLR